MKKHLLLAVMGVWILAPNRAYAYLDPATGSAVLQVLVGGAMGGLFLAKRYWRQLKARFTGRPVTDTESTTEDTRPDGDVG